MHSPVDRTIKGHYILIFQKGIHFEHNAGSIGKAVSVIHGCIITHGIRGRTIRRQHQALCRFREEQRIFQEPNISAFQIDPLRCPDVYGNVCDFPIRQSRTHRYGIAILCLGYNGLGNGRLNILLNIVPLAVA